MLSARARQRARGCSFCQILAAQAACSPPVPTLSMSGLFQALLRHGVPAHHSHLSAAIGRGRDRLIDLLLPGGKLPPLATPPLAFGCVKAALDARRADIVLRLLRAGAPPHGAPGDHTIVDRLVALWSGWLQAAGVDAASRMREGFSIGWSRCGPEGRIMLACVSEQLAAHSAAGLRLEPVHEVTLSPILTLPPPAQPHPNRCCG